MAFLFVLLLLNPKYFTTFAVEMIHAGECGRVCLPFTLTRIFQRHNKKRLLALVLEFRNLVNFIHPRQEGNKRPLGYVYPARRASFGKLCLVAIHIRRGR